MKDNPAVTVMVFAKAGSNNETKRERGIAHFLEHMCMKGGEKYATPYEVSSTLDSIGAYSNACTGYEFTAYYAKGQPKHFEKILDVIADVYLNPRIEEAELAKERGVIVEEINMYQDLPQRQVQEVFEQVLFGDQPAGWDTLGTKGTVSSFSQEDFFDFKKRHYVASNTCVVVAGQISPSVVKKTVNKLFGDMPTGKVKGQLKPEVKQTKPQLKVGDKKTDQTHVVLGVRAFPASHKDAPVLEVLKSVLSGGMSGRLFQKLREEMGVCYYVKAFSELYSTYGFFGVRAGVDPARTEEVTRELVAELKRLADEKVTSKELTKAKEYLVGSFSLGLETSDSVAEHYIDQEVATGELKTPRQQITDIKKVTAEDIQRVARSLFVDKNLNMALVGKVANKKTLKKQLSFSS